MSIAYQVELTDTFSGEPNYSWVKRTTIVLPDSHTQLQLVRTAKKAIGLTNVRCNVSTYGDDVQLTPRGQCLVCFVTPIET